ncbi:recombinase family protein [Nocardia salmonicida]|uniref:recombinase family protein n=1 Tax=Nocardia salmonicida TaxID=53431 RepID=UPI00368EDCBD
MTNRKQPTDPESTVSHEHLAVSYLRVSSKKQMDTARDIDPDGNSIATQRTLVDRKASNLVARIVKEFIEPGVSASTIEKRQAFQDLIEFLRANPEIEYVIVYARSRAFRNYIDAAITKRLLDKLGVKLVSAREDFGDGIYAEAMEAVTDIFNDVQNRLSGEDIRIKLQNKAVNGGTIGRAHLGYLNTRTEFEGRLINTVTVDAIRAPLIVKAFELYATGEYSIDRLTEYLADLGLTTRPSGRHPYEKPIDDSTLHRVLHDPYYVGYVAYKGELFPGRHEPLISQDLFDLVQDMINMRSADGQRDRIHQHYLKGSLYCGRCRANDRTSRLIYSRVTGRNGRYYSYFLCRSKQEGACDLPHLKVAAVEQAIADHYRELQLPDDFLAEVRAELDATLDDEQASVRERHASLSTRLAKLDEQENNLVDLAADGTMPQAKIRAKLSTIRTEKTRIEAGLVNTAEQLHIGATVLRDALRLTENPVVVYRNSSPKTRRHLNQTFFDRLYIDQHEVEADMQPLFDELHSAFAVSSSRSVATSTKDDNENGPCIAGAVPSQTKTDSLTLSDIFRVPVSSKPVMVGRVGLEPTTSGL